MIQLKIIEYANIWGVSPNNVCYWDIVKKELKGSQRSKALKFNKDKCIKPQGHGVFQVEPIKEYNSTTYDVENIGNTWKCNCQWNTKNNLDCSHILAVLLYMRKQLHGE